MEPDRQRGGCSGHPTGWAMWQAGQHQLALRSHEAATVGLTLPLDLRSLSVGPWPRGLEKGERPSLGGRTWGESWGEGVAPWRGMRWFPAEGRKGPRHGAGRLGPSFTGSGQGRVGWTRLLSQPGASRAGRFCQVTKKV